MGECGRMRPDMEPDVFRLIGNHLDGKRCVHTVDGRKSCTSWYGEYVSHDLYEFICKVLCVFYIPGGAGIVPSTVFDAHRKWLTPQSNMAYTRLTNENLFVFSGRNINRCGNFSMFLLLLVMISYLTPSTTSNLPLKQVAWKTTFWQFNEGSDLLSSHLYANPKNHPSTQLDLHNTRFVQFFQPSSI